MSARPSGAFAARSRAGLFGLVLSACGSSPGVPGFRTGGVGQGTAGGGAPNERAVPRARSTSEGGAGIQVHPGRHGVGRSGPGREARTQPRIGIPVRDSGMVPDLRDADGAPTSDAGAVGGDIVVTWTRAADTA